MLNLIVFKNFKGDIAMTKLAIYAYILNQKANGGAMLKSDYTHTEPCMRRREEQIGG